MGFGTAKTENTKEMITYNVTVTKVQQTSKDTLVIFDMVVNGVTIHGNRCIEYKNKDGNTGYMIRFPDYQGTKNGQPMKDKDGNDIYYSHCFFPISKELRLSIVDQIEKKIAEQAQK